MSIDGQIFNSWLERCWSIVAGKPRLAVEWEHLSLSGREQTVALTVTQASHTANNDGDQHVLYWFILKTHEIISLIFSKRLKYLDYHMTNCIRIGLIYLYQCVYGVCVYKINSTIVIKLLPRLNSLVQMNNSEIEVNLSEGQILCFFYSFLFLKDVQYLMITSRVPVRHRWASLLYRIIFNLTSLDLLEASQMVKISTVKWLIYFD